MNEGNKKENIRIELDRAQKTLLEADLLFNNGFIVGAVSRLYYFLFYNIRALLLTKGLEPKSHEGSLRLLGLHFIKEGIFEPKDSHIFILMCYKQTLKFLDIKIIFFNGGKHVNRVYSEGIGTCPL